jgi:hypothetical protein
VQDRIFSDITNFCKNEITLARNVKDRQNSKLTIKNLEKIQTELKLLKDSDLTMGLFMFVGVDQYSTDICEIVRPLTKCNKFVYKCLNKFIVDHVYEYSKILTGSIIFANGDNYYIYVHGSNGFEQYARKKVDLGNRHRKGGQSQHRHERNFDIIKDHYINVIAEETMELETENNWIFGSVEIINKIIAKNPKLQNGGHLIFDQDTINDTQKWSWYLKNNLKEIEKENKKLSEIVYLIETDPDRLEFSPVGTDYVIEWSMINGPNNTPNNENENDSNVIYLKPQHKLYDQLYKYEYIGIKYKGQ